MMEKNRRIAIELKLRGATYKQIAALLKISHSYAVRLCTPPQWMKHNVYLRAAWEDEPKGKLKCEFCGRQVGTGQIHHLLTKGKGGVYFKNVTEDSVGNFNKIENLIFLCVGCHMRFHSARFCETDLAKECVERIRKSSLRWSAR